MDSKGVNLTRFNPMRKFSIVVLVVAMMCIITCTAEAGLFDRIKQAREQRIEYSRQVPVSRTTLFRGYPLREVQTDYQRPANKTVVTTTTNLIRPNKIQIELRGLDEKK